MKRIKQSLIFFTAASAFTFISGCSTESKNLKPSDFSAVPRVEKEVKVVNAADAVKNGMFNYIPDPAIMSAYRDYITTGKDNVVNTDGFIAYPFNPAYEPVIPAMPLQAVDIELEPGEKIQPDGIAMGDTQRWTYTILMSYNNNIPVEHLIFKPKMWDIATNIIIGTNMRTYHFGLVSVKNATVKQVKFWYPDEMQKKAQEFIASQSSQAGQGSISSDGQNSSVIADVPNINIHNLNFDYSISGDDPEWKPVRIFSDGVHTYIQFPKEIINEDMPVLYVYKNSEKQLVNYRAKGNYFVVDGIFPEMVLILGRPGYFFNLWDNRQQAVYITNNKMA